MASPEKRRKQVPLPDSSKGERLARAVVAVMTCLGALGFFALLYFPLKYLN